MAEICASEKGKESARRGFWVILELWRLKNGELELPSMRTESSEKAAYFWARREGVWASFATLWQNAWERQFNSGFILVYSFRNLKSLLSLWWKRASGWEACGGAKQITKLRSLKGKSQVPETVSSSWPLTHSLHLLLSLHSDVTPFWSRWMNIPMRWGSSQFNHFPKVHQLARKTLAHVSGWHFRV